MAKPRVIISTDIGGSDPDDMESMAHALLASDQWDIQALISTPTKYDGRTSDIYKALDAYTKDYANLKTWSDYPTPAYLKSIVYQGNVNVAPSAGYSSSTEASRAIVDAAKEAKAAGEPLWVMTWGAATDVAQALHDDPSIASTIRVLASNGWNWKQDPNAYEYVKSHAENGMWMIDSKSTHRGIYVNSDGVEDNPFNMSEAKGHGALGDYFYWARPWGVKMGDSWSIAYLTDQANNGDPRADSWGGEFVRNGTGPNYWTDDTSAAYKIGNYNGAAHVREHQMDIYKDMYRLFNRAKSPNPNAGDTDTDTDSGTGTPSTGGGNDPVYAYDDKYQLDPGKTLWENTRFLLYNDKGADGGLKVTQVDGTSAQGVSVSWASDGTIKYTAKSGFVGTDTIGYTIVDADGSSDRAKMVITVGDPSSEPAPAPAPAPAPSGGTGNDVYANDDHYALDPGKTMWENSRFLAYNDKGEDGGLKVTQVDGTSANGRAVSWASDGTIKYTAASGFAGTDTIGYTVVDADGSSDRAKMVITVGDPSSEPAPAPAPAPADGAARILPFGDSHTYGVVGSYADRESGGYRLHLADKLDDSGISVDFVGRRESGPSSFDNDHEGYSGIHIQQLTAKVADMVPATQPDVILLMAGSNDAAVNTVSQMKAEMSQLIDTLTAHAPNAHILLAGIPPVKPDNVVGMKPSVISGFNAALPALVADKAADGAKVRFVDTSSLTVDDISGLDVDKGVHLTHAGHEKLAGLWLEALKGLGVKDGTLDVDGATTPLPPSGGDTGGGTGNAVYAVDDHYDLASGATKWEAAYYLARNDKGGDGQLKVTDVDNVSTQGVSVTFENGTIVYRSKAGFNGTDTVGYTVVDEDGSSDQAKMVFTVGDPSKAEPEPTPDPEPEPDPTPTGGTGNDVYAQDDHYDLASGATKWEAARYLTWNDKGDDGSLKVTQVDDTSANGVSISFDGKTIVYKSEAGFNGTDTVGYTVVDGDGSSDRAKMVFTVGDPSKAGPEPEPAPAPTTAGTGNDVNANNDWYQLDAGKSLWVNSRYFTKNDDGPDGGLEVTAVDAVSANGGRISWVPGGEADGGTTKYTPAADFSGRDSFEYTVVDQDGSSDVGTVFVQVVDVFA